MEHHWIHLFYLDIAHWLKPHVGFDDIPERKDLIEKIKSPVSAFDFKELDADPVLQKTAILLLTEMLWRDLVDGRYVRTLIVFDEVWRFFAQSKGFLEEMYRTLRKYKAGIVSITQNLADYGDEAFAKMLFTNIGILDFYFMQDPKTAGSKINFVAEGFAGNQLIHFYESQIQSSNINPNVSIEEFYKTLSAGNISMNIQGGAESIEFLTSLRFETSSGAGTLYLDSLTGGGPMYAPIENVICDFVK